MEDYRLTQTGQEVQDILNGAVMPADLAAEKDRAELAEQALQGKIDDEEARAKGEEGTLQDNIDAEETRAKGAEKQNADDIDALEEAVAALLQLIPSAASSENQLADKKFVTDSYDGLMQYVTEQIIANIPEFKGQFTTLAQLQEVADPKDGDIGIVRTKDTDGHDVFTFYQYKEEQWNEFYTLSYHPQRKPASTGLEGDAPYNGMGRIELPMNWVEGWPNDTWLYYPYHDIVYLMYYWNGQMYAVYNAGTQEGLGLDDNLVVKPLDYNIADIQDFVGERYLPFTESSGVWTITKPDDSTITSTELNNTNIYKVNDPTHLGINVLTQSMLNRPNTIYVIQYDFTLGEDITVPANCVLEFDGGSISNGKIIFNNTEVKAPISSEVFINCTFEGKLSNSDIYISNFHLAYTHGIDDAPIINAVISLCKSATLHLNFKGNTYVSSVTTPYSSENWAARTNITIDGYKDLTIIQDSEYYIITNGAAKTGGLFNIVNSYNITLKDIKIDGTDSWCDVGEIFGTNGLCAANCKNVIFNNCIIKNFETGPITTDGSGYVTSDNSGAKGIQIESHDGEVTIDNCSIYNCFVGLSSGVYTPSGNGNKINIINCNVFGCVVGLLNLSGGSGTDYDTYNDNNIFVSNCNFIGCSGAYGIFCFRNSNSVLINNTKVIGSQKADSIIRGRLRNSIIDIVSIQPCDSIINTDTMALNIWNGYSPFENNRICIYQLADYDYLTNCISHEAGDALRYIIGGKTEFTSDRLPSNEVDSHPIYKNTIPYGPLSYNVKGYYPLSVSGSQDLDARVGNTYNNLIPGSFYPVIGQSTIASTPAPVGTLAFNTTYISNGQPVFKAKNGWVCHDGAPLGTSRIGSTRPAAYNIYPGFMFFDASIESGKYIPIWWTGTAWVDATGAEV